MPDFTIVIPSFNELESLPALIQSLRKAPLAPNPEILFVDDGSTDGSGDFLDGEARRDGRFRVIHLARNFGQTAALAAGLDAAQSPVIVTLDADGQNDPTDIPNLLARLGQGFDVVCGWRRARKDPWLTRRFPSAVANAVISKVTGVHLHDHGCTLKAFRKEILTGFRLYGEMHRLIPVWCAWKGARIAEVEVTHHPRQRGRSHYGLGRTFRVILDLLTAKFFFSYLSSPSHALGGVGLVLWVGGFFAGLFPILDKFIFNQWGHLRVPFIILSVFLGLLGTQFLALGVLAEILVRIYYENRNERPYRVARISPTPKTNP